MDFLSKYKKIVIKIGSSILIENDKYHFREKWLESLAEDICVLTKLGCKVLLVTSGAIASGCYKLEKSKSDFNLDDYQALAAYGQSFLINNYSKVFHNFDLKLAQILLTNDDYQSRRRFLNTKLTINKLLEFGIIPIINENDTISTDEIRFGDNDNLAAKTAVISDADLLILLSDVNGIYDKNPKKHKNANLITNIKTFDQKIFDYIDDCNDGLGTGGMLSKLTAIEYAFKTGVDAIIASGKKHNPLNSIKKDNISYFLSSQDKLTAKRKWMLHLQYKGELMIDNGAELALRDGKSLLAVGVKSAKGSFNKGDIVKIIDEEGQDIAQAIINYDFNDLNKIKNTKNHQHSEILKYPSLTSVCHRDNLVILSNIS